MNPTMPRNTSPLASRSNDNRSISGAAGMAAKPSTLSPLPAAVAILACQ